MTEPKPEPPADAMPAVDEVIHDARETSWHLPETPPSEPAPHAAEHPETAAGRPAKSAAEHPAAPAAAAYPAADLVPPRSGAATNHAPDHAASGHAAAAHGSGHGGADEEPDLGPVDVELWGASIIAAAVGLLMAVCFVLATGGAGAY